MMNRAVHPAGSFAPLLPSDLPKKSIVYPITGPAMKPASEPDVLTSANSDAELRPAMSVVAAQTANDLDLFGGLNQRLDARGRDCPVLHVSR